MGILHRLSTSMVTTSIQNLRAMEKRRDDARLEDCLAKVGALSLALLMYAEDHEGLLPAADAWLDAAREYLDNRVEPQCPLSTGSHGSYGMNPALSGRLIVDTPRAAGTILVYEATESGSVDYRHNGTAVIGFLDAHARALGPSGITASMWAA